MSHLNILPCDQSIDLLQVQYNKAAPEFGIRTTYFTRPFKVTHGTYRKQ